MARIGITGAAGQLGRYTRARLERHHGMEVLAADRTTFADRALLERFASHCDVIVHLAGVNRATEDEVREGNLALGRAVVEACRAAGRGPDMIYSSSIQRDGESVYGKAKAAVADELRAFCEASGSVFTELVLPNLFGEFTRPFYNSFVGTFCHQIGQGQQPSINADSPIALMHYQTAADVVAEAIVSRAGGVVRPEGTPTSVGTVAAKLAAFEADYGAGVFPDLRDDFDLKLFNTYRSYLYPERYPVKLVRHADARGSFFECIRERNGGQTSFSTTVPGITRGNHFHFDKIERFLVVGGKARISIRKMYTDDVRHFDVTGDEPCYIDMPTLHTHNITNTGEGELVTLFWTHDLFDPKAPDTYAESV